MLRMALVLTMLTLQVQLAEARSIQSLRSEVAYKIAVCEAKGELTNSQLIRFKERKQVILRLTDNRRKQMALAALCRQIDKTRKPVSIAQKSLKWW